MIVQVVKAKNMEIMGRLYKTKEAIVCKVFSEVLSCNGPMVKHVKFKNLDIKYYDHGTDVYCNLDTQGINDKEVIKYLDDYFISLGLNASGDCLDCVKNLGFISNIAKYIID